MDGVMIRVHSAPVPSGVGAFRDILPMEGIVRIGFATLCGLLPVEAISGAARGIVTPAPRKPLATPFAKRT
jgi:hypothetical protein